MDDFKKSTEFRLIKGEKLHPMKTKGNGDLKDF